MADSRATSAWTTVWIYLGEMEFQKLTYVDNGVPSLSIGGFTNGVRVVDMAKGYSTLANGGVYNDPHLHPQRSIHEHDGELTKDLKPHLHTRLSTSR